MALSHNKSDPRKRHWFIRIAIGAAILALGIGAFVTFYADADLTDICAKLDHDDPTWRLEDLEAHRKDIPAEQNSALHVASVNAAIGGNSVGGKLASKILDNLPPQARLNIQQLRFLRERISNLQKPLKAARKLKDMPDGRVSLAFTVEYYSTRHPSAYDNRAYELLKWDAALRVDAGDADGALESCRALLNAVRHFGDDPFLNAQMARYDHHEILLSALERVLAQGQPTEAALNEMQKALANEISEPTLRHVLRGERAGFHQFMTALAEEKVTMADLAKTRWGMAVSPPIVPKTPVALSGLAPRRLKGEHARVLRLYSEMVEAANLPLHEQQTALAGIGTRMLEVMPETVHRVNAARQCANSYRFSQSLLRCTMTALAAERYRLAYEDWPRTLDNLVSAKVLDEIPDDPFVAGKLKLKHRPDGITIYSVGLDGVDDDGAIDAEASIRSRDIGFRLWNVQARRQAPLPTVTIDAKDR